MTSTPDPVTVHPIDTEALRRLADQATPGPWEADTDRYTGSAVVTPDDSPITWDESEGEVFTVADAEFIAAARTAVPALLDENAALRARIKAARDVHNRWAVTGSATLPRTVLIDIRRALEG